MTWLYILLGIILFILLLMLIPIGFKASYTDEVKAVLLIGFIPIPVYPIRQSPKNPRKRKSLKSTSTKSQRKKSPKKKRRI